MYRIVYRIVALVSRYVLYRGKNVSLQPYHEENSKETEVY